jgi:hypothetical protein
MNQKNIKQIKNKHKGSDIWVLAAGPTLNYIDKSFFKNKITVGVNRVCKFFECDYVVAKDGRGFKEILENIDNNAELILSKHESGNLHQNLNNVDIEHYVFDHPSKPGESPNISCIHKESDEIVVSYSTITSAIHVAAYLGADNIIIVGHDCGTIDGNSTILGYYDDIRPIQATDAGYVKWLSQIEGHTAIVCKQITKQFGCNIHSLNPFINLNLEGHKYDPSNKSTKLQRNLSKKEK